MTCTCVKRSELLKHCPQGVGSAHAKTKVGDFILVDNQDNTYQIFGVDAQSQPVDISAVAKLSTVSSDQSKITVDVDSPTSMTGKMHALAAGTATLTFTATWNDGSVGPFSIDLPVTIQTDAVVGLLVVPGTPTVRVA